MKVNRVRQNVFPMIAALIWGTSFVAQSVSADHVEAFTFNTARSVVAFLFLSVLCVVVRKIQPKAPGSEQKTASGSRKELIFA